MQTGFSISIIPNPAGGVNIHVAVMEWDASIEHCRQHSGMQKRVVNVATDIEENDVRTYINRMTRLVARCLEEDLYESLRMYPRETDPPRATRQ